MTAGDTIRGTWSDTTDQVQRSLSSLAPLAGWDGAVDIAVGGTVLGSGESYAQAARGDFDDRWRAAAAALAAARGDATGPTFVRPWHEFNGDWYPEWQVSADTVAGLPGGVRPVRRDPAGGDAAGGHRVVPERRHPPGPARSPRCIPVMTSSTSIGVDSYDWTRPGLDHRHRSPPTSTAAARRTRPGWSRGDCSPSSTANRWRCRNGGCAPATAAAATTPPTSPPCTPGCPSTPTPPPGASATRSPPRPPAGPVLGVLQHRPRRRPRLHPGRQPERRRGVRLLPWGHRTGSGP